MIQWFISILTMTTGFGYKSFPSLRPGLITQNYFNFQYLDIDRPNDGMYFELGVFWSLQEELEVHKPEVLRLK